MYLACCLKLGRILSSANIKYTYHLHLLSIKFVELFLETDVWIEIPYKYRYCTISKCNIHRHCIKINHPYNPQNYQNHSLFLKIPFWNKFPPLEGKTYPWIGKNLKLSPKTQVHERYKTPVTCGNRRGYLSPVDLGQLRGDRFPSYRTTNILVPFSKTNNLLLSQLIKKEKEKSSPKGSKISSREGRRLFPCWRHSRSCGEGKKACSSLSEGRRTSFWLMGEARDLVSSCSTSSISDWLRSDEGSPSCSSW